MRHVVFKEIANGKDDCRIGKSGKRVQRNEA